MQGREGDRVSVLDSADFAMFEVRAAVERSLIITRVVLRDVFRVSRYGKEAPTQEDMLLCNYACKNDLADVRIMLETVEDMLQTATDQALALEMGEGAA